MNSEDETWSPPADQLRQADAELESEGVAVHDRPDRAVMVWLRHGWAMPADFAVAARRLRAAYAALHPSVDFSPRPFVTLAVSALGVPYALNPPMVFGQVAINPLNLIRIGGSELERIYAAEPAAFWDLHYQAADGFDLFMGEMNFYPRQSEAAQMLSVGTGQLEASARQLLAGAADGSLPQAMCLAAELTAKAVLREHGLSEKALKTCGHSLPDLAAELAKLRPGPNDAELLAVAASLPRYVKVRYSPPDLKPSAALDLYRRGLFLSAEALRRASGDSVYWQMSQDARVPARAW